MSRSVDVTVRHVTHAVIYQLSGEWTPAVTPEIGDRLLAAVRELRPPTAVVFDLDGLTVLSAVAVRVLSDIAVACRSSQVPVSAVLAADHPIRQVAGLISALPVFDTAVSALERLATVTQAVRYDSPQSVERQATEHGEEFTLLTHSLLEAETVGDVLSRVVRAAAVMLPTANLASVTVRDPSGALHTPARSDPLADRLDALQYQFHEGPCYDSALPTGPGTAACPDLAAPEVPWPKFAPLAVGLGMSAVMSTALISSVDTRDATGALNVYSRTAHGLDDLDHDVMLLLATHASLAVSSTRAEDYLQLRETQLRNALDTRDVIGQAKGIIMARRGVAAGEAFDILRRASQDLNIKLVELAQTLASRHGELDG